MKHLDRIRILEPRKLVQYLTDYMPLCIKDEDIEKGVEWLLSKEYKYEKDFAESED